MSVNPEMLRQARQAVGAAEALIIIGDMKTGAHGTPSDPASIEAWRRSQPAFAKAGPPPFELADPACFQRDPAAAWGFFGHCITASRSITPDPICDVLLSWAAAAPRGYFVFTSSIDGNFQKAGFAEERMVECHGSLLHLQCAKPCCAATWPVPDPLDFDIEEATMRARFEPPRCIKCGGPARPNVLMFNNGTWISGRTLAQQVRFDLWLRGLAQGKVAVLELGAHADGSPMREAAEQFAASARTQPIRLEPAP